MIITPEVMPTHTAVAAITFVLPTIEALTAFTPGSGPTSTATIVPEVTATLSPLTTRQLATPQLIITPGNAPQVIGSSYEGRPIYSYRFGSGAIPIIFVGGLHGGYEWNTILLAYQAIDYFKSHPDEIPQNVTLFIIPVANPDGLAAVTQKEGDFTMADLAEDTFPGRFNGRGVDLNRNWDCQWTETGVWRDQPVSGGIRSFSEPESRALRDDFLQKRPALVLFWHSAADGVFTAGCPETDLASWHFATVFGRASGYPIYERFPHYPITGDAGDWLTTQGIPSISIELKTHEAIDWQENLAGMLAILDYYSRPLQ